MATLEELRQKLDGIDDQIAELYEKGWKSAGKSENIK